MILNYTCKDKRNEKAYTKWLPEGDAQSNIEEDAPLGDDLPMISPYGIR